MRASEFTPPYSHSYPFRLVSRSSVRPFRPVPVSSRLSPPKYISFVYLSVYVPESSHCSSRPPFSSHLSTLTCTSSGDRRRGVSWSLARSTARTLREEVYLASSSPLGAVPGAFGTPGFSLALPFVAPPSPVDSSSVSTSSLDSDSPNVAKTRAAGPATPPPPSPQKPRRRIRSASTDSLRVQFQTPVGNRDVPPHIKQTPRTPRLRPAIWGDINRLRFTPPPVNDDDSLKPPSPPFDFDKHYQEYLKRKENHREPSPHRDVSPMPSSYASLPGKNERRAPRWDTVPRTLGEFLDEYEELCAECGAGEAQMIDSVARYAPNSDVRSMWKTLSTDPSIDGSWTVFRKLLIYNTPGADDDRRHTKSELDALVNKFRVKPMRTRPEFHEYWQRFLPISTYLRNAGRLSTEEQSRRLMQGLPTSLQARVRAQLRNQYPTHHPEDPFSVKAIYDAINFVLTGLDSFDDDLDDFSVSAAARATDNDLAPAHTAPRVTFDLSKPTVPNDVAALTDTFQTVIKSVMNMIETFNANVSNGPRYSRSPATGANAIPTSRPPGCIFCSDLNHYARECQSLEEYISKGFCHRNAEFKICLPDGSMVLSRTAPGEDIKERIDNWRRARNPQHPPIVSENLVTINDEYPFMFDDPDSYTIASTMIEEVASVDVEPASNSVAPVDDDVVEVATIAARIAGLEDTGVDDIPVLEAMLNEGQQRLQAIKDRHQARSTTRTEKSAPESAIKFGVPPSGDVTMKMGPEGTKINTPATLKNIDASSMTKTASTPPPAASEAPKSTFAPVLTPASFPATHPNSIMPQYRFVTPIESERTTIEISKRAIEPRATLTTGELLTIAPDVRKFVKDNITTRRIPTSTLLKESASSTTDILAVHPPSPSECFNLSALPTLPATDVVVAKPVECMRTVVTYLDGHLKVGAIIDNGSQIIVMSREAWEKLGVSLCRDHIMTMEAANKSLDDSMDFLQNLRFFCFYFRSRITVALTYGQHERSPGGVGMLPILETESAHHSLFGARRIVRSGG
ncbi:hypothetical protein DFP72DRAFT_1169779 [Ephemerocybe angulata]|uniref:CCHC-type domain-containing protein n=1 Tax=Ephemerocybe angulata TaxID=980116 RepID=A0A8H6HY51_9AGAR|nr:hypothetical protein DFP72DRAFT_1169779 [Tulosesus angulatus]